MVHLHHTGHAHTMSERATNERMMRRATYFSVTMALGLLAAKIVAWWSTESLAMLSSLTDSLFDVVSSIINMIAVGYALKPADEEHRFGHTSIEDIAGLAQFAFISASMILIILQSAERLFNPHPLSREIVGIWVSLAAMGFTIALVTYQTVVTRRTGSLVIAADRMHYAGDVLFNLGVLFALFLSMRFGIVWADPAIAILIALVVLWSTREIGVRAFNNLMDREMPDAEKEKIHQILAQHQGVLSYHKMKTRYSGAKPFIQMHVDIDNRLNFLEAHAITDKLEANLLEAFPHAEIIIHPDPVAPAGTFSHTA
jgi:ferrous-iron efflux pump FieF